MQTKNVKISYRNFFHVYGFILTWIGFILVKLLIPEFPLSKSVLLGLLVGSIISLIIYNTKYLLTLEINDSNIKISYFRFYLVVKKIQYSLDKIEKIICNSDIFSSNEIILILKDDKKKYSFDIPIKKMSEFLSMKMEISNLISIDEK